METLSNFDHISAATVFYKIDDGWQFSKTAYFPDQKISNA